MHHLDQQKVVSNSMIAWQHFCKVNLKFQQFNSKITNRTLIFPTPNQSCTKTPECTFPKKRKWFRWTKLGKAKRRRDITSRWRCQNWRSKRIDLQARWGQEMLMILNGGILRARKRNRHLTLIHQLWFSKMCLGTVTQTSRRWFPT